MVSPWSLSDNKSPQVSRTLLTILADICPVISKSSSSWINPLVTVPRAPITIAIIVTSSSTVFQFPSKVQVLIFLFAVSISLCGQPKQQSPQFSKFSFFFFFLFVDYYKVVVKPRLGDLFICQNPRGVCVSYFPGQILVCVHIGCLHGQTSISCIIPNGSPCLPRRV